MILTIDGKKKAGNSRSRAGFVLRISMLYLWCMQDTLVQKVASIIKTYLPVGVYSLFLFGSRATLRAHRYADIDIGIEGKQTIPFEVMARITGALEESDLPVRVDVVDFAKVTPEFARLAKQTRIPL